MSTFSYFNEELNVSFTMSELYNIATALADQSFVEQRAGRNANAELAWIIRDKVKKFIEHYESQNEQK